jgi:tRNA modification GTPase
MRQTTISAISTANGRGGVAIIRISGPNALSIVAQMFSPRGRTKVADFEPYRMYPGEIQAEYFTDFGMCVYFKAPKSYTGENMVEFHCHGGTEIAQGVLKRTFALGATPAEAGEFTKRAFLNGKMSLSAAEGVADMINANSESMIHAGYSLLNNTLGKRIVELQNRLKNLLASIEVDIDYPEEELEHSVPDLQNIKANLSEIAGALEEMISSYTTVGKTVARGITVAIVGRPNSGKSSLLNAILGKNKAIVSDIEGTTRDIVEGEINIKGIHFHLFDTAGIRESRDGIEQIGVEKAEETLDGADIVLHVIDRSKPLIREDEELFMRAEKNKRLLHLTVLNKSDLPEKWEKPEKWEGDFITLSAKAGKNIEQLLQKLYEAVGDKYTFDSNFVVEERHYKALCRAEEALKRARDGAGQVPLDMLTIDISECWQTLGEITGETANEEIIGEIFSKFCVGK